MALTLPALLGDRAAARPDHPLLVCDDVVLTYDAADHRSAALAKGLLAAGFGPGAHVGLLFPNGADFTVAALAAGRIGAVAVPVSTFSTGDELRVLLRNADVTVLLAARRYRRHDYIATLGEVLPAADLGGPGPIFSPELPALRAAYFEDPAEEGPAHDHPDHAGLHPSRTVASLVAAGTGIAEDLLDALEAAVDPSDRLVVVHTSGSTAAPKGVVHTHGGLLGHLGVLNGMRRFAPDDVLFCASPFFWVGGYAYALMGALEAGGTLVCSNAADPSDVLDLLQRVRPTMCNGFVASVAALAKDPSFPGRDLTSMRRGNLYPIMPADCRPADPELRHNMLGMTEAGSVCLASTDEGDQPEHRRGSFGRAVPDLEAKVSDPDTNAACGPGEAGELCLRGPALMEGYWGRERHDVFDADGWYHTGDQFVTDADGFFYFRGRRGDMIKTAGANVSPREVEAAILAETGLVAHVLGVDDEARGQLVAAAVRVPPGAERPDPADIRTRLKGRLSAYKVPQRILVVADDDVPMMSSGKLDARALKARFLES